MLAEGYIISERFRVESTIGKGGFGMVYRATQLSTGQPVAIKVLHAHKMNTDGASLEIARFEREMKLIGALRHPNVVRLVDTGELEEGILFQVLEFVDGIELARMLHNEGALKPREAKDLMFQVLDALSAAHSQGIIHRDMKPANIMVTSQGFRRNAMVLDFGIAGIVDGTLKSTEYETLTMEGRIHGTPSYMPPEQLRGKVTNGQADLYSWGLVFLECLTGCKAIRGETFADTIAQVVSPDPIAIPEPLASHPLGAVIAKAIAKDQEDRYLSATEVLRDLQDIDVAASMTLPWTGSKLTNEEMVSGSMNALSSDEAPTVITDSQSVSASLQLVGLGDVRKNSSPDLSVASGDLAIGSVTGEHEGSEEKKSLAPIFAAVAAIVILGVVAYVVSSGGEERAADAANESATGGNELAETQPGDTNGAVDAPDAAASATQEPQPDDAGADPEPDEPDTDEPSPQPAQTRGGATTAVPASSVLLGGGPAVAQRLLVQCNEALGSAKAYCNLELFSGSASEEIAVSAIQIDTHEVTVEAWQECVGGGVCKAPKYAECQALGSDGHFSAHSLSGAELDAFVAVIAAPTMPVTCVTRGDAEAFCAWAGKRLPSEAEWESTATNAGTTDYPWGNSSEAGGRRANGADLSLVEAMRWGTSSPAVTRRGAANVDRAAFVSTVGAYGAGATKTGVHDLAGNVKEWVSGEFAVHDRPAESGAGGIAKGGSWADVGPWLSGRSRVELDPDSRRTDLGFRCVTE